jgi:excisionase family DNA binding protein
MPNKLRVPRRTKESAEEKQFMSVHDAAYWAGCSTVRIYQLIKAGTLPATRLPGRRGRIIIPRNAMEGWVGEMTEQAMQNLRPVSTEGKAQK